MVKNGNNPNSFRDVIPKSWTSSGLYKKNAETMQVNPMGNINIGTHLKSLRTNNVTDSMQSG